MFFNFGFRFRSLYAWTSKPLLRGVGVKRRMANCLDDGQSMSPEISHDAGLIYTPFRVVECQHRCGPKADKPTVSHLQQGRRNSRGPPAMSLLSSQSFNLAVISLSISSHPISNLLITQSREPSSLFLLTSASARRRVSNPTTHPQGPGIRLRLRPHGGAIFRSGRQKGYMQ